MRLLCGFMLLLASISNSVCAQERFVLHPEGGDPANVELFIDRPDGSGPGLSCCLCMGTRVRPARARACSSDLTGAPLWQPLMKGGSSACASATISLRRCRCRVTGPPQGRRTSGGRGRRRRSAPRLDYLWSLPGTDRTKVVVYGVSGGAATASMVATTDARITALILVAGLYDLGAAYPTGDAGHDATIEREAGTTPEAFAARAALRMPRRSARTR